jgi:iron complex outermembrane receptor protein
MKRAVAPSVLAAALGPFTTAAAQESAQSSAPLETVVVTAASGRAEELQNLPQTIDVISGGEAAATQPTWVGEVLNKLPGVYFAQLRGPVDMPAIRLPLSSDNTELYLQDNVPLQSPISFNHAAFAYSAALTSPGGMEVLKGPGTALHGSDAFAAVINVRSLEPTAQTSGALRVAGGSFGTRDARAEFSSGISANQAWRIAVSRQEADGWRDMTGWERTQAVVRHRWTSDRTQVNTILVATEFDSEMAAPLTLQGFLSSPRSDGLDPLVPRDRARDEARYVRLSSEVTHSLSDRWDVQVTPYLRYIDSQYMATWEPATVPVTQDKTETAGVISRLYANWSDEAHTVFGVDVERTELHQPKEQVLPTQVVWGEIYPQGFHYDYTVDYLNLAPYVQHSQRFSDRWEVVAGLRYESAKYDYDNRLADGAQFAFYRPADRKDNFSALNPKLGINWAIVPDQNVFFRYAHGFRIPSATALYALSSSQTAFSLDPEQINSYEIGYKGALGEKVTLTAAAYRMKSYDGLTTGVATAAGTVSANGGKREYSGIEVQLDVSFSRDVRASLAMAWQDSEIVRDRPDGTDPRGVNGKTPTSQSDELANLTLSWTPSIGPVSLAVDYDLQLIGSWWIDDQNTLETPDEYVSNLRIRAGSAGSNWAVTAKVLNLFDRTYATTAADAGFGARYRPGDPRSYVAGVEYSF